MPQIRAIALAVVPPSLSRLLLRVATFCQLLNVVHHAIQAPLRVDLVAASVDALRTRRPRCGLSFATAGGRQEDVSVKLLLGADGLGSAVRKSLGVDFPGTSELRRFICVPDSPKPLCVHGEGFPQLVRPPSSN